MAQWQDNISLAEELVVIDAQHLGPQDLTGFTANTGSPDPTNIHVYQSGWLKVTFNYIATNVQFDTISSNYDTMLAIYSGTPGSLVYITSDDDSGGLSTSKFTIATVNPGTYFVMVSAWNYTSNATYFNITSPSFPLFPIRYAQSQARLLAFNVPQAGQAQTSLNQAQQTGQAQAGSRERR